MAIITHHMDCYNYLSNNKQNHTNIYLKPKLMKNCLFSRRNYTTGPKIYVAFQHGDMAIRISASLDHLHKLDVI